MTLVELLIVITIIVILMAVSIPLLRPAIRDGHVREASRQVNVFIASAKARAAALGREAGVMFKRTEAGANTSRELYLIESPLPYTGDVADDSLALMVDSDSDDRADYAAMSMANNGFLTSLVNKGDLIQFDYRGPFFRVTSVSSQPAASPPAIHVYFQPQTSSLTPGTDREWGKAGVNDNAYAVGSDDGPKPPPEGALVPYQILRQPTRSTTKPLQLAAGMCVDLQHSGMSFDGTTFAAKNDTSKSPPVLDDEPVVILFNPTGGISRVYYGLNNGSSVSLEENPLSASGTVFLLVGKLEQAAPTPPATATAEITNLQDSLSTWIAITDRTGAVTVAENDSANAGSGVALARTFARTGQSIGGR